MESLPKESSPGPYQNGENPKISERAASKRGKFRRLNA